MAATVARAEAEMSSQRSIEDQILDRLMEKLRSDDLISAGLVSRLEDLRREGLLSQPEKLLEAYRAEVKANGGN